MRALAEAFRRGDPRAFLPVLVAVQWAAVLVFALGVQRNGWLYYQGGDQMWNYTSAWFLAHGELVFSSIGPAMPLALTPVAGIAGPRFLDGLPVIVLLNVLVLLPLALIGIYALGARLGGRLVGLLAAGFWVLAPWAAIPLFDERYHEKYVEQFLPQALGLTLMSDFPVTVAMILAAVLALRALDAGDWVSGSAAGLAAGLAIATKPSLGLALPAFALAFLVARRYAGLLGAAAGFALPLLVLAVWKYRGLGQLPVFALPETRVAAGVDVLAPIERWVDWNFDQLDRNFRELRGIFWSSRFLMWLPLAGSIALARRSLPAAILFGGWLLSVVVIKGGSVTSSVDSGSFFRFVMPTFPALCVLAASLVFLVPTYGGRLIRRLSPSPPGLRATAAATGALGGAFALGLVVILLADPLRSDVAVRYPEDGPPIPMLAELELESAVVSGEVRLSWNGTAERSARTFYRIFRGEADGITCYPNGAGAEDCQLHVQPVGETRATEWSERPPPGDWTYRVAVAANWLDDITQGDPFWISGPVRVVAG